MRLLYSILKRFSNNDLLYVRKLITEILVGELTHNKQSKLFWDDNGYARNVYISPHNPSKNDLDIYKKYLTDTTKNKKVLLLGSTPLLRYLLNDMGFKHYVLVDFSFTTIENSVQILKKLGMNLDPENEIWLKSEWLEMPLVPDSFDYIVGDLVFTQIEPSKQQLFVKKLASLLKQNGNFITRIQVCDTCHDDKDPKKLIEETLHSSGFKNATELRFALLYRLRDRLRDKETQTTSLHVIINELLQYKTLNNKEIDIFRSVIQMLSKRIEIGIPFITQTKNNLKKSYLKNFYWKKV